MSSTTLSTSLQSVRDWLASGWIFELATPGEGFLIGGGLATTLDAGAFETQASAVWTPPFFDGDGGTGHAPFATRWTRQVSREELLDWLNGSEESDVRSERIPSSKISWTTPRREAFDKAFARIQKAFREEGVKKAVPAVFSSGITAAADRLQWISNRLRAGLVGTHDNSLRLYGSWSEAGGFLGATPEALFTRNGKSVSSMAVAGTRAIRTLGPRATADAIEKFSQDFLEDAKERNEHALVVQDIEGVLGKAVGPVNKTDTAVHRFGALLHLVTHLSASGATVTEAAPLVEALHPTPALGVSPREPGLGLLRELHTLCGDGVRRENFGAPFVVKHGERVEAIVAIRQVRWTFTDSDRIQVVVGSGCGIVPESDVEREWLELASKRRAVMKLFRVSTELSEPVMWSIEVLERLLSFGVRRFIVCAGARNAPLVVAAEALRKAGGGAVSVDSFFEERSAAFYALGVARASGSPVAILTTSGTAVAELLPAIVEADFSGVPLVAVTADRPRRLRHSGAPQSIPQDEVLTRFAERTWDLEEGDEFTGLADLSGLRPIHVNVCLEEPLLVDAEKSPERLATRARQIVQDLGVGTFGHPSFATDEPRPEHALSYAALSEVLTLRRSQEKSGVVAIVGGLVASERDAVAEFLSSNAIPCLIEAPSGLRGDPRLKDIELRGGDRDLQRWCLSGQLPFVIRLGGVPTARVWRDLDEATVRTQTLSISRLRFSGLGRGRFVHLPGEGEFASFLKRASAKGQRLQPTESEAKWLSEDRATCEVLDRAVTANPLSEPSMVRALSKQVARGNLVYVGNSLPIRWWDMVATRETAIVVEANRGVNGIDGQLSTALGLAAGGGAPRDTWILVGDLTALYDLTAPWALAKDLATHSRVRIVVLNNSGGRIFTRVLAKAPGGAKPFENEHALEFKNWAKMWNLGYALAMSADEIKSKTAEADAAADAAGAFGTVIELRPSAEQTAAFWAALT